MATARLGTGEERALDLRRKAVHVGCGLIALSFRVLTWQQALLLALGAFAFNLLLFPRIGGRSLQRPAERERGFSAGMLLYPLAVAGLVAAIGPWRGLVAPAMGWALLAFGDGAASVAGLRFGRRPLPWNPRKSVEGSVAHAVAGAAAALGIGWFVAQRDPSSAPSFAILALIACAAAIVTALVESLDSGIDDNILVAWSGGLVADVLIVAAVSSTILDVRRAAIAAASCAALGLAAALLRKLTVPGALAAALLGTLVAAWGGWGAFVALGTFFVLGVGATRLGRAVKEARGIAEPRGGRRGVGNVLANGGMALVCALHAFAAGADAGRVALVALVAALATAAFDTVSSEVGKAHGRTTILITTLRRVSPGTEGAVSLEGTLAGVAGAAVVGVASLPVLFGSSGFRFLPVVLVAAFVGTTFESVVGATFERGGRRLHNDVLNFANTLVGALSAAGLMSLLLR